jgi:hypothetical protein
VLFFFEAPFWVVSGRDVSKPEVFEGDIGEARSRKNSIK